MKRILLSLALLFTASGVFAQCCSGGGGGGGTLAGNFAQGVLLKNQFMVNLNFQHIHTGNFREGSKSIESDSYHDLAPNNYLDGYDNKLLYLRTGYGLTKKLSIFVETGFYLNKTEYRQDYLIDVTSSTGMSDLTIIPNYNIFLKTNEKHISELTVGMGIKIPMGPYNDSVLVYHDPNSGTNFYDRKSPSIQISSGSNDFRFTSILSRRYLIPKIGLALNMFYIHKGWNPMGEKFGDYFSSSFFFTKTVTEDLTLVAQLKGEFIGMKKLQETMQSPTSSSDLAENSGSTNLFITPGLVYTLGKNFSIYARAEIPIYQHVNGIQLAAQYNYSAGVIFRSSSKNKKETKPTVH